MKRFFTGVCIALAILLPLHLSAQNSDECYIEVHGMAERSVTPDRLTFSITLSEKNYRGRTLDEMEKSLLAALKNVGINVDRQLKVRDLNSTFKKEKAKNQEAQLTKSYSLELNDEKTAAKMLSALEETGIANVYLEKAEYSGIEALKLEVKAEAMRNAKNTAEAMMKAVGQELGKAFYVYEQESNASPYRTKSALMLDFESVPENAEIPELEFQEIKVTARVTVKFRI